MELVGSRRPKQNKTALGFFSNTRPQPAHDLPVPKKQGGLFSLNLGQNNGPFLPKDIMLSNKKSIRLISQEEQNKSRVQLNGLMTKPQTPSLRPLLTYQNTKHLLNQRQIDPTPFQQYNFNQTAYNKSSQSNFRISKNNIIQKYTNENNTLEEPEMVYDHNQAQFTNYVEKNKAQLSAAENITANSQFLEVKLVQLQEGLQDYKDMISQYREDLKEMNEEVNRTNILSLKEIHPMLRNFQQHLKTRLNEERNENYKLQREIEQLSREKMSVEQNILFCHKRIMEQEKFVGINKHTQADINIQYNNEEDFIEDQYST